MPNKPDSNQCAEVCFEPIGCVHSPFTDKFGIPRQANLIKSAQAEIELYAPYNDPDAVQGLDQFSHIWLTFRFHLNTDNTWRPKIRPPRLGGNSKIGVFASRSPFRPNNLGQSLVELREVIIENNRAKLIINCPDLLNGTPIYDIKPYIHYSDSVADSQCAYADEQPTKSLEISTSNEFKEKVSNLQNQYPEGLESLIFEVVSYDPRPAYKQNKDDAKLYKLRLYDLDISFKVVDQKALIMDITKVAP